MSLVPDVACNGAEKPRRRKDDAKRKIGVMGLDNDEVLVPEAVKALAMPDSGVDELEAFVDWMRGGGLDRDASTCFVSTRFGIGGRVDDAMVYEFGHISSLSGDRWVQGYPMEAFIGILHREAMNQGHRVAILDTGWKCKGEPEVRGLLARLLNQKVVRQWLLGARVILMPVNDTDHWYYLKYTHGEITVVDSLYGHGKRSHAQMGKLLQVIVEEIGNRAGRHSRIHMNLEKGPNQQDQKDGVSCGVFAAAWLSDECNMQVLHAVKNLQYTRCLLAGSIIAGRNLLKMKER